MQNRLYVLLLSSLPMAHKAVQGGHALAQWMLEHPNQCWNNETLIYLSCDDLLSLVSLLKEREIDYSEFREPDRGMELTAIAHYGNLKEFKGLKLIS